MCSARLFSLREVVVPLLAAILLTGCATVAQTNSLVGGLGVTTLGNSPTTNLRQTYYLGVFDPREQLPPTIYRLRVHGQASALSRTAFASGWVRADLVDSLSGKVMTEKSNGSITEDVAMRVQKEEDRNALDRRLIMFGPEGFREAPKNHRLVVVMGSNPSSFFNAVDSALGTVAEVSQGQSNGVDVVRELWQETARLREEKRATETLIQVINNH